MPKTLARPIRGRIPSKQERHRLSSARPQRRIAKEKAEKRAYWGRQLILFDQGLIQKDRTKREQLRGLLKLTSGEQETVRGILKQGETVSRERWQIRKDQRPDDMRSLEDTQRTSKVNIGRLAENLHQRFKGRELVVLIEGCGFSTVGEELTRKCEKKGIKLRILKTDIYPRERFESMARELNSDELVRQRGVQISSSGYVQATPEMLLGQSGKTVSILQFRFRAA